MTTIFLENQVEGCPQYVEYDPYYKSTDDKYVVSVSEKSEYSKTLVKLGKNTAAVLDPPAAATSYNVSNELFMKFLLNNVFKIYKDATTPAAFSDYTDFTTYSSDPTPVANGYYKPAQAILTSSGSTKENTHFAGTIFTYTVTNESPAVNFNCALILEETFNDAGTSLSKVDIEMRLTEPLMQTIRGTTGNVYDFKENVKVTDFMGNLEQRYQDTVGGEKYIKGFLQFNVLNPTNMSEGENVQDNTHTAPLLPTTDKELYTLATTAPLPAPSYDAESFTADGNYTAKTSMTGYFVMLSFGKDVEGVTDVKELAKRMPYMTILRIANSSTMNTQFQDIFHIADTAATNYKNNCILDYTAQTAPSSGIKLFEINTDDLCTLLPFDLMLESSSALQSTTLSVEPTAYCMSAMVQSP